MRFSRLCYAVLAGSLALTAIAGSSRDDRRVLQPAADDDLLVPPLAPPKIKVLIRRLQSPHANVRQQAAEALGELGPQAADAVPALMAATSDPRNYPAGNLRKLPVYHACRDAIVTIGKPGVPYIIPALNNPNQPNDGRCDFMQLLCDVADKHGPGSIAVAVPSLTKILSDDLQAQSPAFAGDAARALGQAGRHARSAVPTLIRALAWRKSQTFAYALIRIAGPHQPQARACLAQLRRNARLKRAANAGNLAEVKALLKAGADVNAQSNVAIGFTDNTKSTPLINASLRGDVAIVKVLLDAGADPNIAHAGTGKTALDYAKQRFVVQGRKQNHDAVIQLLKAAGGKSGRLGKPPGGCCCFAVMAGCGTAIIAFGQQKKDCLPPVRELPAQWSKETVESRALAKQRMKDVRCISLYHANVFHRRLVRTLGPKLPENIRFRHHGSFAQTTVRRKGIIREIDERNITDPLEWTVEGTVGIFGFWISTARTNSTVTVCNIEKRKIYLNVDWIAGSRSVDEKLPELGGRSVKQTLQILEKACAREVQKHRKTGK